MWICRSSLPLISHFQAPSLDYKAVCVEDIEPIHLLLSIGQNVNILGRICNFTQDKYDFESKKGEQMKIINKKLGKNWKLVQE